MTVTTTPARKGRGRRCDHAMVDDLAHITVHTAAELARATCGPDEPLPRRSRGHHAEVFGPGSRWPRRSVTPCR